MLVVWSLLCLPASAAPLRVRVLFRGGDPFPGALVVVKSLEGGGEVLRALGDASGMVPYLEVRPGLYQAIATCPIYQCSVLASASRTSTLAVLVPHIPLRADESCSTPSLLGAHTIRA